MKRTLVLAVAIGLAASIGLGLTRQQRAPLADEFFYLAHALAFHDHGRFAMVAADGSLRPALAAPLYPALLAASMRADAGFAARARCWVGAPASASSCGVGFGAAGWVAIAAMGLCVGLAFLAGARLIGGAPAGVATALLFWLSGVPQEYASSLLTEVVTVPLVMAGSLLLALAPRGRRMWPAMAAAGVSIGLAALGRPSYFYGGLALAAVLPGLLWWLGRSQGGQRRPRAAGLAFLVGFLVAAGPWKAHEHSAAEDEARMQGYAVHTLVYRTAYNAMTPTQYAAAWIYWLPDFGDSLARRLFGRQTAESLSFGAPDGFYTRGARELFEEIRRATGVTVHLHSSGEPTAGRPSPMRYVLEHKVLGELPRYLATTAVLLWRGAFPGKLVGLAGLVALVAMAWRSREREFRQALTLLALPAASFALLHAAISINIPRYNIPLLLPYTVAIAAAGQALLSRRRRRSP
ncbi:MAG: hypothetical protein H6977_17365 [Gammaproteobacteria bacterium]|nr:hypothetical protein [Gammaproteobacteria bacterium]